MNERLRGPVRAAFFVVLCVVALPVLLIVGLFVWYGIDKATGEGFDSVRPAEMARRATDRSQEMYEASGLTRRVPSVPGGGDYSAAANVLSADFCHQRGIEGIEDTPEPRSYRLYHEWRLNAVTEAEGTAALDRLEAHLKKTGWTVTGYRKSGDDWELRADKGYDDRLSFTWWSHWKTLEGFTGMPCAYDPAGAQGEDATDGLYPPVLRPAQR
ncbi:hypothetical protein ABZO31_13930 [Streptomyces sp. HUAS MG47]|uniref:hypothetical protein n=1 Tax=Streptomyces solicamelliae TaxID=3231716 RepID=UPI003877F9E8